MIANPNVTQAEIQQTLDQLAKADGFAAAIDALAQWSEAVGYTKLAKLSKNPCFELPAPNYQVTLKAQVNIVRSLYSQAQQKKAVKPTCPICFSQIASTEKPLLRAWETQLQNADFFIQCTPFPLASKHIVIIQKEHTPMRMNGNSVADGIAFVDLAPNFTALSNSDVIGAGASVSAHHHYQAIENFELPIMQAKAAPNCKKTEGNVTIEALHFPMASLKLTSHCAQSLIAKSNVIIQHWKQQNPGKNSWNFALRKAKGNYCLWLIARNCEHLTPERYRFIKQEGLGIVEVAGEAIYPTPTGAREQTAWDTIRNHGLEIFLGILAGNNPLNSQALWKLTAQDQGD